MSRKSSITPEESEYTFSLELCVSSMASSTVPTLYWTDESLLVSDPSTSISKFDPLMFLHYQFIFQLSDKEHLAQEILVCSPPTSTKGSFTNGPLALAQNSKPLKRLSPRPPIFLWCQRNLRRKIMNSIKKYTRLLKNGFVVTTLKGADLFSDKRSD